MGTPRRRRQKPPRQRPERRKPEDLTGPKFQFARALVEEGFRDLERAPGPCTLCGANAEDRAFVLIHLTPEQRKRAPWARRRSAMLGQVVCRTWASGQLSRALAERGIDLGARQVRRYPGGQQRRYIENHLYDDWHSNLISP